MLVVTTDVPDKPLARMCEDYDSCLFVKSHLTSRASVCRKKMLPRTQWATKVKIFVAFSLKCSVAEIECSLPWMVIHTIGHFSCG